MAKRKREIENYAHSGKERANNPPVGLVTPETDRDAGAAAYAYDPHLDPRLDVEVERSDDGEHAGKVRVSVHGFDYYNTRTGGIESGGSDRIAVWMLDPDYDGRSLFPRQVFFPMTGAHDGWTRLARSLRTEIDQSLIAAYRGTVSLPFAPGEHERAAVKIVDDRGIESLKIMELTS